MSRLNTFLTYEDYAMFVEVYHCTEIAKDKIGFSHVPFPCSLRYCPRCILYRDTAFKAESKLTQKET